MAPTNRMAEASLGKIPTTRRIAPAACAYHNVWFDPPSIEDIRVHGIRSLDGDSFKAEHPPA